MGELKYALIMTTFDSKQEASVMAKKLLTSKLAACVHLDVIESFYNFQGECHNDQEYRLQIKTQIALYDKVETFILDQHSYDTPEIILLPIQKGSTDYFSWMDESLNDSSL